MSAFNKFRTIVTGKTVNQDRNTPVVLDAIEDVSQTPTPDDVEQIVMNARAKAEELNANRDIVKSITSERPSDQYPSIEPSASYEPQSEQLTAPPDIEPASTPAADQTIETKSEFMPLTPTPSYQDTPPAAHSTAPRSLGPARRTDNLSNIRQDLAQLNEDMSTGEQFYAQSLKRISNLINYAYETEANLSALEHLEPENIRLKSAIEEARKTATEQTVRAESLKSKADAYEARYLDSRQSLEKAQLALTQMEASQEALQREISDKDVEISGLKNSNRTIQNNLAVDRQAAEKLSSKNLQLSSELSVAQSERLELEKRVADLQSRYEDLGRVRDELERMIAQTRSSHKATEEHNLALKTELEQVLADVQVFKKQFDSTNRNKTHELNTLRAKASDLEAEVAVKTDVVKHAHDEMAELREKFDSAHRGRRKLLEHIETQKRDMDALREQANTSKAETAALASKLMSHQAETEELRRLNQLQSDKLKRYLAINTSPLTAAAPTRKPVYPERSAIETPIAAAAPLAAQASSVLDTPEFKSELDNFKTQHIPDMIGKAAPASTDFSIERRSADRPFQGAPTQPVDIRAEESARFGMVGGISADHAMGSKPRTESPAAQSNDHFDAAFNELQAAKAPEPIARNARSEAEEIEDTLSSFHELDLLEQTGRTA